MHLIQLLLPITDNDGHPTDPAPIALVRQELTERFGGVTAYTRAPAAGFWKSPGGGVDRDEMIMVEVVVESFDRSWWTAYRRTLEERFSQDAIHARAIQTERI